MIQIDQQLISTEVFSEEFVCDLGKCKGACCVEGDSGAPLTEGESQELAMDIEKIKRHLRTDGIRSINSQGTHIIDKDGDMVTPLVDGKECAYTVFSNDGTAQCGIELAWQTGDSTLQKPISCHLYPIRTKQYESFEAVNYERWQICSDACSLGKELKVPVYKFLRVPLIRKYGAEWYALLEEAESHFRKMEQKDESTK